MPKASFQDTGPRRDNTPAETKPAAVGVWDQSAFTRFMATRDPVQEKKDQTRLRDVFAAAQSTIAKEAFAWAEQNGVKFFIDCSLKSVLSKEGILLIDSMILGLSGIAKEYGSKYLALKFEEV